MKKKFLVVALALIIGLFSYVGTVKAANESEVSDREMAIASALSYVPLRKNKTMKQCFDLGDAKAISKVVNFVNSKFNLHDYATIEELDNWIVDDYCNKVITQKGFTAFRLINGNNVMIVIRGSNSPVDAFEDIKYGLNNFTIQEKYLKQYINSTLKTYSAKDGNYKIYVTGHSLGGYLAQIGGATVEEEIKANPETYKNLSLERVVDFNGIGINFFTYFGNKYNYGSHKDTIETLKKLGEDGRLIEYYTYGDLVSALGVHYGEMRMLTPSIDSITYHRSNYQILGTFGKKIISVLEDDKILTFDLNSFKTDINGAQDFYQTNNIAAYLNLTHEADPFASIELAKGKNAPSVRIIENQNILSSHKTTKKSVIKTNKNVTLKALTSYASAKKYEWYVSTDKQNWTLIKTVDLYNIAKGETITNTLDIDIKSIPSGESRYYKVVSHFDDNYISSTYHYNTSKKQFEYAENKELTRNEEFEPISAIMEVQNTSKASSSNLLKNVTSKLLSILKKK